MTKTNELIKHWREVGPVEWAEGPYGWIMPGGEPVTLAPWQRAVLTAWWEHREGVTTLGISNVKKTGKTFLDGVLTAWRWLALPGLHFCAANDLDQSTSRQFSMIAEMVKLHPYLRSNTKITNKLLTFTPSGSVIQALAVDATGNAGANHLTASHTECWGVIHEHAIRAYEELTPPPGKTFGLPVLRVCDGYAGFLGESETWHGLVDRGLNGERVSDDWPIFREGGLLLFHMEGEEAQGRCFRGTPDERDEYYTEQGKTLRENAFQRLHANTRTTDTSRFLPEGLWASLQARDIKVLSNNPNIRAVFGADGSTSRDHTALVGSYFNRDTQTVDFCYARTWKPRSIAGIRLGKPTIDLEATLGAEILRLHEAGQLEAVVYDPYQLHTLAISWQKKGIRCIELPQTAKRTEADQAFYDACISGQIRHYGDPTLTKHINQAVARETVRGFRLDKDKTPLKIDAAVAASMSHFGALQNKKFGGVKVVKDPFSIWPPPDDYEYNSKLGYIRKGSHQIHPPGVTHENCRHRMRGCAACVDELEASGYYDQQEAERPMWEMMAKNREDEIRTRPMPAPWTVEDEKQFQARTAVQAAFKNIQNKVYKE